MQKETFKECLLKKLIIIQSLHHHILRWNYALCFLFGSKDFLMLFSLFVIFVISINQSLALTKM